MNKKIRLFYGVVGFILLIFLGVSYAWSIFVQPLEEEFGWLRSQTSIAFTISMVFFCVGNLRHNSPRCQIPHTEKDH